MNNNLKKMLGTALSLAMVAGTIVVPAVYADDFTPIIDGDNVLKEWKLDFGSEGSTPETGYTLVTPDAYLNPIDSEDYEYGFMGTNYEDYNFTDRYDGWKTQKGQTIELAAGGTAENDAIGVIGAGGENENAGKDIYGNQADKFYPVRFAMKVPDETYYRVKATVTTLNPEKDATVSLYTERKHPIYTERIITKGTTDTITFSVRVTPLYYEKSEPKGTISDKMLTVGVVGENSAIASLEIQQVETIPTFWILGDSTVTDGNTTLPFFTLQNYTGYGTGFMKYLPRDMAMVNAGEGGLASGDQQHFKIVSDRIKEGDYLFFEYGHNETVESFKGNLDKYYDLTHNKGAKLIISSPAERINIWQNDKYVASCEGYQTASEEFAASKVAKGADDIAFVGLSTASINFINKVVTDNGGNKDAIRYYYRTTSGNATDTTHFNDTGAENIAYLFFEEAKKVANETYKAVLKPILDNMTDEKPNPVPSEIISNGVGSGAWPQYIVPSTEKYPVLINDVTFNKAGEVASATVTVRAAEIAFDQYGILVITVNSADGIEKGKIYSTIQVDNSTGLGEQTLEGFTTDTRLEDGDTYSAVVLEAYRDESNNLAVKKDGIVYSAVYKPTDIAEQLLVNERNDEKYENFDYFGAKYDGTTSFIALNDNGWQKEGSSGSIAVLNNEENGLKYGDISIDGVKNGTAGQGSFTMAKPLAKTIETKGRYLISADIRYVSGGGTTFNLTSNYSSKNMYGTDTQALFTIGADGKVTAADGAEAGTVSAGGFTNVQAILDCDMGTLEVTVEGNNPVTVQLDNYKTTNIKVTPEQFTHFMFGGEKKEWHINVANLMVAKMKDKKLPSYTLTVNPNNSANGTIKAFVGTPMDVEMEYSNGNVIVTTSKAISGELIEAKYMNGVLSEIIPTSITFTEAGSSEPIPVTAGSKLMFWDSVGGMKPLANVITAFEATESAELTKTLNTVVTVQAVANDGYVFEGWSDGTNIISTDAEYSFRLRGDLNLTANFASQGGVEDVKSFVVSADRTRLNIGTEQLVNLEVNKVFDELGNPVNYNKDTDVLWTCNDSEITVEKGIVTIPASYTMDNFKKTVTVTCTINGINRNVNLVLYSCDYYEDFSAITDFSSWISNTGTTNSLFGIIDTNTDAESFAGMSTVGSGNVLVIGNNSNGAGKKLAYEKDLQLSSYATLKFGFEIEPNQIRKDGKDAAVTLQFVDSEGTKVFDISVHTGGKNSSFNGTEVNGFINGTVIAVDTELDFASNTMKYTLTNADGKVLASGTSELTAKNLDRMYFSGDWQYGKFAMDNVYAVYQQ